MEKSVVIGTGSLVRPLSVKESVILGPEAGKKHATGYENVFIGKSAGYMANGNQNIYIGANSGYSCQGSGNIFVGYGINATNTNNTLRIGNAISASLLTGHTVIPSLEVKGNITFGGILSGMMYEDCVRVYDTNVGNLSQGVKTVTFGNYAGYANTGHSVVALGSEAGYANRGHSLVAIGDRAGVSNTGINVIAIGNNTAENNTRSGTLFIGDFIEGTPSSIQLNRPLHVDGWRFQNGEAHTDTLHITSNHIRFTNGTLSVSDTFCVSKPLTVLTPKEYPLFYYLTSDLSCVQQIESVYYGLSGDGHVYTSQGKGWTPIRSPSLTSLSKTHDNVLVGYGSNGFVRYTSNGWVSESRDQGVYSNRFIAGSFAVGSSLSNPFYEDEGCLLQRTGSEWRLYPGTYLETFTDIAEWKEDIYATGPSGLYTIGNRCATHISSKPTEYIGTSPTELLVSSGSSLFGLDNQSPVKWLSHRYTFNTQITRIYWDQTRWLVHTSEGVFASPSWIRIHTQCRFLMMKYVETSSADLIVPESIKLGRLKLTEQKGLVLNDGTASARVYDTVFNTLPIRLHGIKHMTVEKDLSGRLCFNVLSEDGNYSQSKVSAE